MLSAKYQESLRIAEYPLPQLLRLGRLEIHIALSNPNIDVRILAHCYCVDIEQDEFSRQNDVVPRERTS